MGTTFMRIIFRAIFRGYIQGTWAIFNALYLCSVLNSFRFEEFIGILCLPRADDTARRTWNIPALAWS
jgi:hypothetical protein